MYNKKKMDDFQEDNIRPPDEVITEQLVEDNRCEFQKQMDEALYISLQEIKQQEVININFEEQLIREHQQETNRRKEIFNDFLLKLNKIIKFDKEVREIYEIIEPIIDGYCNQALKFCTFDKKTYDKIFNILKNIRNNEFVFDTLKLIILSE